MDESAKRSIKKTILALRKLLEKEDIPAVLKQYGIFPDGRRIPVEKLALLVESGKKRRERLEAVIVETRKQGLKDIVVKWPLPTLTALLHFAQWKSVVS
jgi:hypothetical protein